MSRYQKTRGQGAAGKLPSQTSSATISKSDAPLPTFFIRRMHLS